MAPGLFHSSEIVDLNKGGQIAPPRQGRKHTEAPPSPADRGGKVNAMALGSRRGNYHRLAKFIT